MSDDSESIAFPKLRANRRIAEAWAAELVLRNQRGSTRHRFPSPLGVLDDIERKRSLPSLPWPANWPRLAARARCYPGDSIAIIGPQGGGKCLAPDTEVLRYDGTIVRADEVRAGDLLMGPDGPRRVLSTTTGSDVMYRIVPVKGRPWVCNSVHVLTLIGSDDDRVIDVGVDEYLRWSPARQKRYKLFTHAADFPPAPPLPIDPWFLGIWYGDGTKDLHSVSITTMDPEVVDGMGMIAERWGLTLRERAECGRAKTWALAVPRGSGENPLLTAMRKVWAGDRLPPAYLVASRADRLAFLAGLLDSDGHLKNSGGTFELVSYHEGWARDLAFLARSLGLRALVSSRPGPGKYADRTYWRVHISGHTNMIPTRVAHKQAAPRRQIKDALRTGFEIQQIGLGRYCGWTLDGDGRFLLGDFTVTHNTSFAIQLCRAAMGDGIPCLWCALELDESQIALRLVANMHGVHTHTIRETWPRAKIAHALAAVDDMWRFVDRYPDPDTQLGALRDAIVLAKKVFRCAPLVVIDYLGKMASLARDIRLATIYAAEQLRALAVSEECFVALLAQPSRSSSAVLTGRSEIDAATDAIGAAGESSEVEAAARVVLGLVVMKADDSPTLDAHVLASKTNTGLEGREGFRFSKAGGQWHELDYLPATPSRVKADAEADKRDRHRSAPPRTLVQVRADLNRAAAGTVAAQQRAAVLEAIARGGIAGVAEPSLRGVGRAASVRKILTELTTADMIERVGDRLRLKPRGTR